MTESTPELPGFEDLRPDATAMERAAVRLLEKLRSDNLLGPEHVLIEAAIVDLARAVGMSARAGKAAGMAMAAKELREFMALLPTLDDDELTRELREIEAASERARAEAAKATK